MGKWVYLGGLFPRGPYRGETAAAVVESMKDAIAAKAKETKQKVEAVAQDSLDNLKPW